MIKIKHFDNSIETLRFLNRAEEDSQGIEIIAILNRFSADLWVGIDVYYRGDID